MRKSKELQSQLMDLLREIFGDAGVYSERSMRREASDLLRDFRLYAPIPDITVGPLNLTPESEDALRQIETASCHPLIAEIKERCASQNESCNCNPNPRCLLAIEIEFSGSPKYILGDFVNASMMGYVGTVVSSSENSEKLKRVQGYARFLRGVNKANPDFITNVAFFKDEEFITLLRKICRHQ